MQRYILAAAVVALAVAPASALPPSNAKTLEHATEVLDDLAAIPVKSIPRSCSRARRGVAIIPRVVKAGFVFAGRGGHGIVFARDKNGNWSDPVFVNLGGASVGFQAGVESTDVVLVFRTRQSLERLFEGKGKLTLGADASVAAGPVGRKAAAATDGKLEAEVYSYSRSRGLFAGVSLDGAVIRPDDTGNAMFRKSATDMKAAEVVKARLNEMSRDKPAAPPVLGAPTAVRP